MANETHTAAELTPDMKAAISDAVRAAVQPVAEQLRTKVTNNMGDPPTGGEEDRRVPATGKSAREDGLPLGIGLARWVKAVAVAKMEGTRSASEVARRWGYQKLARAIADSQLVEKQLLQGDFDAGGSLVHQEYAAELVELLRNRTVIRQAGARQIPMPGGNLTWDRQAGAATAFYGAENSSTTPSNPTTEQFALSEKKLTALVPVSNDLIRNASIGAEEWVRDDLVKVMALREDLAFLRGVGASGEPQGLRNRIDSTHVYAETIASAGSPTLAEAKKELAKAINKLDEANIPSLRRVWIMAPRTRMGIFGIVGPGGEGTNNLERELAEKGTLYGYPVFITNQVPINLGTGSNKSELYLVEMSEVVIGDSMRLEVEVFPNAAYNNSGTIVSGVSNDLTVIRAIGKHDINMLHVKGGVVVHTLTWGQ